MSPLLLALFVAIGPPAQAQDSSSGWVSVSAGSWKLPRYNGLLSAVGRGHLAAGFQPGNVRYGLTLQGSHQNGPQESALPSLPSEKRIPGDLWMLSVGPTLGARHRIGPLGLGGHGALGLAAWMSPIASDAYEETIVADYWNGKDGAGRSGFGPWAQVGPEVSLQIVDAGPALLVAADGGYCIAGGLESAAWGLRVGFEAPL